MEKSPEETIHYSEDDLMAFFEARMSDLDLEKVDNHLGECESCRTLAGRIASALDIIDIRL